MKREEYSVVIPKSVLKDTIFAMREAGNQNMEWFGLWLCPRSTGSEIIRVSEVFTPEQYSSSSGGRVIITGEELQRLNRYLYQKGLRIFAQIHSHPEDAFHSWVDDMDCIATTEGAYSIVVPNFGRVPYHNVSKFAFFRLYQGQWTDVPRSEVKRIFRVE